MKALILANGELYQSGILQQRVAEKTFDLIIGVDGGTRFAQELGVEVNVVIGDLDSLKHSVSAEVIKFPVDKDQTDLELALVYAKNQGVTQVVLLGTTGGRLDMTLANIFLLANEGFQCFDRIEIWHASQTAWLIRPPGWVVTGNKGDTLSLIPVNGKAFGVTTHGLKFALTDETLDFASTRGISNVLTESEAKIEIRNGLLLGVHDAKNKN